MRANLSSLFLTPDAEAKVALIFSNGYLRQGSQIHLHWGNSLAAVADLSLTGKCAGHTMPRKR